MVVIGGGTGSFTVLRGLKKYPLDITAVVSTFDSGGSTGKLRDELGVLPPGDVRRCLVALSDESVENVLRRLFLYRFSKATSLNGHSFGNLFLAALSRILKDDALAIAEAAEILNIRGRVLPVSLAHSHLYAQLENGKVVAGESNIDVPKHDGNLRIRRVFLKPRPRLYQEATRAIKAADLVVIGPGDLYTSIVPNLLVAGVPQALRASRARKVYVCNLMTKWGETNDYSASSHARVILEYAGLKKFDYIICNRGRLNRALLAKYARHKSYPVPVDRAVRKLASHLVLANLAHSRDLARHDSGRLAKVIYQML